MILSLHLTQHLSAYFNRYLILYIYLLYLFYCFFVVVHDTSIKSFLTFFFFFCANYSVILTKIFSQCCRWLRFAAQPKLLFFYSRHPDVCTAIIVIITIYMYIYIEKISTFVLPGVGHLPTPGPPPRFCLIRAFLFSNSLIIH